MKTTNNMHQVNGSHYENLKYEPVQLYQSVSQINWFQAEPIKYISGFWDKNGITDLNKAKHILSMARDMGIRRPYELVFNDGFLKEYCVQFHKRFNVSTNSEINEDGFANFIRLLVAILWADWNKAIEVLDQVIYYFYGEEEQKVCQ